MVDKRILEYFRMHRGNYKLSDLKNKVLQAGYTEEDIDATLSQLNKESQGNPPSINATINKINKMNFDQYNTFPGKQAAAMKVGTLAEAEDKIVLSSVEKRRKKWALGLLLSIFFGYLGMDRFYSGHILLGFFKLIILTVVGIWWILEIFLIAFKIDYSDIEWV